MFLKATLENKETQEENFKFCEHNAYYNQQVRLIMSTLEVTFRGILSYF